MFVRRDRRSLTRSFTMLHVAFCVSTSENGSSHFRRYELEGPGIVHLRVAEIYTLRLHGVSFSMKFATMPQMICDPVCPLTTDNLTTWDRKIGRRPIGHANGLGQYFGGKEVLPTGSYRMESDCVIKSSIYYIPWESKTIKRMVFRGPERELPLLQPVKI